MYILFVDSVTCKEGFLFFWNVMVSLGKRFLVFQRNVMPSSVRVWRAKVMLQEDSTILSIYIRSHLSIDVA